MNHFTKYKRCYFYPLQFFCLQSIFVDACIIYDFTILHFICLIAGSLEAAY